MNRMVEFKQSEWQGYNAKVFLAALDGTGLPHADLVIREALQNSYDARKDVSVPADFNIKGKYLSDGNRRFIEKTMPVAESQAARKLVNELNRRDIFCLQIRDTGTVGLNGPYQDDEKEFEELEKEDRVWNYKDFVWGLGGDKESTKGGSFGVGKTSLFLVSRIKTICIYSRTRFKGRLQSRFIIKSFYPYDFKEEKAKQYWFSCEREKSPVRKYTTPLPFLDEEADYLARGFGMDEFGEDETGTCSFILDVCFSGNEDESPRDFFVREFPRRIEKWFWTKLLPSEDVPVSKRINISLYDDERKLKLEDPSDPGSRYFPFFRCYELWRSGYERHKRSTGKEEDLADRFYKVIAYKRPRIMLGGLVILSLDDVRQDIISEFFPDGANFCLVRMRDIEFCINYNVCNYPLISRGTYVFALFHTDPESRDDSSSGKHEKIDESFRRVENRTHDGWDIKNASGKDRNYVARAIEEIQNETDAMFKEKTGVISTLDVASSLSTSLGRFLPYGAGTGVDNPVGSESRGGQGRKISKEQWKFEMLGRPRYGDDGWRMIRCLLEVDAPKPNLQRVFPVIMTIDGTRVKSSVADDRVVIEGVRFGCSKDNLTEDVTLLKKNRLRLDRKGCYVFSVKVYGDIEFDFRVEDWEKK